MPADIGGSNYQANPRKAQKHQQYPKEAERYAAKLLAKAEIIVASANKLWGMSFPRFVLSFMLVIMLTNIFILQNAKCR